MVGDSVRNTLDHKCPKCNAVLKFNPHGQNWKCEYCRAEYEEKNNKVLEEESSKENANGMDIYICNNCGAQIVADENTSTTSCVYCKNTAILKNKLQDEFNPDYLIPFRYTKEDAIGSFKKLGKGKILMPRAFNDPKNINEMSGIYIPFWLYDYDADGVIEANCNRITTWTRGDYMYTKTDTYLAIRGGKMSFDKVPVDGSKRFENDIMNSIEPFDYKDLKDFNYSYLSGFLSEKYDVTKEEAENDAIKRVKSSFTNEMKNDIRGYNTVLVKSENINLNNKKNSYVLLPVWMLNIKYKEKIYTFAMNGQTGKLIGNIPIDKKKAVIVWSLVFIVISLVIFLVLYLKVK